MRSFIWTALFALTGSTVALRDYNTHDYYAVHIQPGTSPHDLALHLGLEVEGPLGVLDDHYLLRRERHDHNILKDAVSKHKKRKRSRDLTYRNDLLDSVLLYQKQKLKAPKEKRSVLPAYAISELDSRQHSSSKPAKDPAEEKNYKIAEELKIEDPLYHDQWHLYNYVQPGHDLNVTGLWQEGITGKNTTVCIVDDGLDMDSEDLKANYFAEGSYDFNDQAEEPKPRLSDDKHGTRCAGEVAAVKNDVCGIGVAWDAKVAGIRILSKPITDSDEAEAMTYGFQKNDIYSCSWGPPDDGKEMGEPGILIKRSMVKAIQDGRGGKGTIYVFAAGNGAARDDNCNFDGYTNSIYSITVGAIDRKGLHPYYSEKCSAQLVVTYSSGSGDAIHTTNVGGCVNTHGGTSAAGPLAAGVFALVLQVRPELTWRDMQWLTVDTAVPFDAPEQPEPYDWQETAYGKKFSHQYGYGKLDAWALVEAAKDFKMVKPQAWFNTPWQHIRQPIPQNDTGLASHFSVTKKLLKQANLERLEHVTVTLNVDHTRRGDLSVDLKSPSGIVSHLSTARRNDEFAVGYEDWTFMSVAHWGESGEGDWTIIVKDTKVNEHNGTFIDWRLNLFGECIDAKKQNLLPMPTEKDDDDHDREDGVHSTISVEPAKTSSTIIEHPSDHPDRPVNQRPSATSTGSTATSTSSSSTATTTAAFAPPIPVTPITTIDPTDPLFTNLPSGGSSPETSHESESASEAPPAKSAHDSFLPSPFPTFGVSKRTQVWIYGSVGLIVVFCASIATYLFLARRRQRRELARENYEFDRLDPDDDDVDDANGGPGRGLVGGKMKGKKRAGELYDAFAGESDEDLFSEAARDEGYRDDDEARGGPGELDEKRGVLSSDEDSSGGSGSSRRPR